MLSKKTLAVAATITLLTAGAALAAGGLGPRHGHFGLGHLDLNEDGKITQAEIDEARAKHFNDFDTDGSGTISQQEMLDGMERMRERHMAERFARMDADKSGALSADEFSARMNQMMEHLDDNKDGVIDENEMPRHKGWRGHHRGECDGPQDS